MNANRKRKNKRGGAPRVRPGQVSMHKRVESPVKVNTMRQLLATEPYFAYTARGPSAFQSASYIQQCQAVMGTALRAYVSNDNAVSYGGAPRGVRRRAVPTAHRLSAKDLKRLRELRNAWLNHLKKFTSVLLRSPPSSGGETARWTPGTGLWLLICHAHRILRCNNVGAAVLDKFQPSCSRYLTRNLLVSSAFAVPQYPLSLLVDTIYSLLEHLETLDSYDTDLVLFINALQYRTAAFVCGAGTAAHGFDAPQWLEPVRGAHTGRSDKDVATTRTQRKGGCYESCTTEFVCESMVWFITLHHFIDSHHVLTSRYAELRPTASALERREAVVRFGSDVREITLRSSVAETRAMRWMPNAGMVARVRQFFYEYAKTMKDDRYTFALRSSVLLFAPLPGDSNIYRLRNQTDTAIPRNILNMYIGHQSGTGSEYMRHVMCTVPTLAWLHDEANWRAGDATVRSASLGRVGFFRQLAALFVVHMYMRGPKVSIRFRHRFVLFQRAGSFFAGYVTAKRNGWPFIVQQFGLWTVVVPHRKDPVEDAVDLERSLETLSTRDALATERLVADIERHTAAERRRDALADALATRPADEIADMLLDDSDDGGDGDDSASDGSYSYSYAYSGDDSAQHSALSSSDDEADFERELMGVRTAANESPEDALAREMAQMTIEVEENDAGEAFAIERTRTYGEHKPPIAAKDDWLRTYDCATFFEAFALWAVALLHCNDGIVNGKDLTDFFVGLFGWQTTDANATERATTV